MITYTYPLTITNNVAVTVTADDIAMVKQFKENAVAVAAGLAPWQWPTTPLQYLQNLASAPQTVTVTVNLPTGSTQAQADAVFQQQKAKIIALPAGQNFKDLLTVTVGNTAAAVNTTNSVVNGTVTNPIHAEDFAVQDTTITAVGSLDAMHVRAILAQLSKSQNLSLTEISARQGVGKYGLTVQQMETVGVIQPGVTSTFLTSTVAATPPTATPTQAPGVLTQLPQPGYLTPPQVATAYSIPGSTGAGMRVAIISAGGGFQQSDLQQSFNSLYQAGLISTTTAPTINQVLIDGATGVFSTTDGDLSFENTADIYAVATVVPAANITIYIGNGRTSLNNCILSAVADHVDVITISYGYDESFGDFCSTGLAAAEASKIPVVACTGDYGSAVYSNDYNKVPQYPASSPKVIAVGGTHLVLNTDNTRSSETAEINDARFSNFPGWGGGGGISTLFSAPGFQTGLTYTTYNTTTGTGTPTALTMRGTPDISAAMNAYVLYYNNKLHWFGGTSVSAPFMAGVITRLKQITRVNAASVDWNTFFYSHRSAFYDINTGNNATHIADGYAATTGWDAVTGLGVINGKLLYGDYAVPALTKPAATDANYQLVLSSPNIWTGKFGINKYSNFATDSAQNIIMESLLQTTYNRLIATGQLTGKESTTDTASILISNIYSSNPLLAQLKAGAVYAINLVESKLTNDLKNYTTATNISNTVSNTQLAVNVASTALISTGKVAL